MTGTLTFEFGEYSTEATFPDSLDLADVRSVFSEGTVLVFDSTTFGLFGSRTPEKTAVVLPAGEASKRWECVETILTRAVETGLGRDATLIGVGGGVVCDLTAFAASLYMRGCGLALVPTTLLAMVDAALGGKTGIDFAGYKNLVGTYYPASRLIVVCGLLTSLPEREYLTGLAEAIKTAMIGDAELFALLEHERKAVLARDSAVLAEVVRRCLTVKGAIVSADLKEEGGREVLNLGHTFGHALESCTGFSVWTHGEAVAWGIGRAVAAGLALGETDKDYAKTILALLRGYGYTLDSGVKAAEVLAAMAMDKKRRRSRIRVVVPAAPGKATVRQVDDSLLERALAQEWRPA